MMKWAFILFVSLKCSNALPTILCSEIFLTTDLASQIIEIPSKKAQSLKKKIQKNQSVALDFKTELELMLQWNGKGLAQFLNRPEVSLLFEKSVQKIKRAQKKGISYFEFLDLAMEFSILMDIQLGKQQEGRKITDIIDPVEYFGKRKYILKSHYEISIYQFIGKRPDLALAKQELFDFLIFIPTFKSLDIGDMVRTPNILWLGLATKIENIDLRPMTPSEFFAHDLAHNDDFLSMAATLFNSFKSKSDIAKGFEEIESTAIHITNAIERLGDTNKKRVAYAILFIAFHEGYISMSPREMIDFLTEDLANSKKPDYVNLRSSRQAATINFLGPELRSISMLPNAKDFWRETQLWLIENLRESLPK